MKHHICKGGCEGVSPEPVHCGAKTCPSHGKPLEPCDCGDGKHYGAFEKKKESENE